MRLRSALALSLLALLAACAQASRRHPAGGRTFPDAGAAEDARAQAIVRHRQLAQKAREAGDLATAAVDWKIVVLLAPGEPSYRAEQDAVNAAIRQGVREQLQAGNAALKGGDNERATQAMLRVLALDPANEEAAKALRDIDRQRMARIQGDRAQKLRPVDMAALKAGAPDAGAAYDLEQPLEMLRAGDVNGGLRELKAYVDANPGNRAARQKIGNAVADRARELQGKGSREQAFTLYEQAVALRGESTPEWNREMQSLRKSLSDEYYSNGERAYRTDVALAIKQWETSLRYDPQNLKAANRLRDARAAQEKLKGHRAGEVTSVTSAQALPASPPNLSAIFFLSSRQRSRSSLAFWLFGSSSRMRSHLVIARSRFCRWNACVPSRSRLRTSATLAGIAATHRLGIDRGLLRGFAVGCIGTFQIALALRVPCPSAAVRRRRRAAWLRGFRRLGDGIRRRGDRARGGVAGARPGILITCPAASLFGLAMSLYLARM